MQIYKFSMISVSRAAASGEPHWAIVSICSGENHSESRASSRIILPLSRWCVFRSTERPRSWQAAAVRSISSLMSYCLPMDIARSMPVSFFCVHVLIAIWNAKILIFRKHLLFARKNGLKQKQDCDSYTHEIRRSSSGGSDR